MDKYLKTSRQSMPDISRKTGECLSFNRQIFKKAPNPSRTTSLFPNRLESPASGSGSSCPSTAAMAGSTCTQDGKPCLFTTSCHLPYPCPDCSASSSFTSASGRRAGRISTPRAGGAGAAGTWRRSTARMYGIMNQTW